MGAAGAAGERLKSAAAERGLDPEGLKDMARDVADSFSSAVTGKADDDSKPGSMAKSNPSATQPGRGGTAPSLVPDNRSNLMPDNRSNLVPDNRSGPNRGPR
jgi:hypothetical protein